MKNKEQHQADINRAYELRLSGLSYREIGKLLGVSHVTAMNWCTEHLAKVTLPLVDEVRKTEVDRMQRQLARLEERAEMGDDKAIALIIRISERLCKMLGADMPTQIQVAQEADSLDLAIVDLIASQKARNALEQAKAAQKNIVVDTMSSEGESDE